MGFFSADLAKIVQTILLLAEFQKFDQAAYHPAIWYVGMV